MTTLFVTPYDEEDGSSRLRETLRSTRSSRGVSVGRDEARSANGRARCREKSPDPLTQPQQRHDVTPSRLGRETLRTANTSVVRSTARFWERTRTGSVFETQTIRPVFQFTKDTANFQECDKKNSEIILAAASRLRNADNRSPRSRSRPQIARPRRGGGFSGLSARAASRLADRRTNPIAIDRSAQLKLFSAISATRDGRFEFGSPNTKNHRPASSFGNPPVRTRT